MKRNTARQKDFIAKKSKEIIENEKDPIVLGDSKDLKGEQKDVIHEADKEQDDKKVDEVKHVMDESDKKDKNSSDFKCDLC